MLPKLHLLFGAVASLLLWLIFPSIGFINALIIAASSVLIDIDHYLYYVFIKKDLNPKKAYLWFMKNRIIWLKLTEKQKSQYKRSILLFHGIEFVLILAIISFASNLILFIFIGILIHLALDFIDLYLLKEPFYQKTSQLYTYAKNQKRKNFGL